MFTEYAREYLAKEKRLLRLRQVREQETQWARKRTKERYNEVKERMVEQKIKERKEQWEKNKQNLILSLENEYNTIIESVGDSFRRACLMERQIKENVDIMEKTLLEQHQKAQKRGNKALLKERKHEREQKTHLQEIILRRNKALKEAYERASKLVKRYRSLHEGSEEQTQFPPTSIPKEETFHQEFGIAVIRTFMPTDLDSTEAARIHQESTQNRIDQKIQTQSSDQKRAQYRFEEAHFHLEAEKEATELLKELDKLYRQDRLKRASVLNTRNDKTPHPS